MQKRRALVVGSKGMLGYAVAADLERAGYSVKSISRADFDIARDPFERFVPLIDDVDMVVNCAGVIKPQIATMSIEDVLRVNTVFPRNLGLLCKDRIHCYHVTTDCVYSGRKGNYSETDFFDAEDVYGMSKNGGDTSDAMTLRTSIIGEESGQQRSLLSWAMSQHSKEVNGFTNHRWNGVTTTHLSEVIRAIEEQDLYQRGIFHIHSPEVVTKFELVQLMSDVYELDLRINPQEAAEASDRSLASVHSLSGKVATKSIRTQLEEMKQFFSPR
ncbi:MAG: sugar nucleotide-binding protein [Actinomycetota bacterium]